ncbi:hypothetical protein JCM10212_003658 [Sporobolomyces blumeae]
MLADLDLALKKPLELVQKLYRDGGSSLDSFEDRVESTFSTLLNDARTQLPAITSLSKPSSLPPQGSLVRFRGMVQDTGYGGELYRALGSKNEVLMYGAEETDAGASTGQEDYSKLRERQVFYVVSVPGETRWVKQRLDGASDDDLESGLRNLSIAPCSEPSSSMLHKIPLPSEPHFGLIVKVYGDFGDKMRSTDVYDFVGILGETTMSSGLDAFDSDEASSSQPAVPALHVISALPPSTPIALPPAAESSTDEDVRRELVEYLARAVGGDLDAAQWILLALVARIHTRHASGLALGALSLNLAVPPAFSPDARDALPTILSELVPTLASLSPTISSLNDPKSRFAPRSRDESLDSGLLQLPKGTTVCVDMRGIAEGKLQDSGVRNLRSLATTIAQQKLAYEFPFSSFELDTDLNFILLSEGKAILPTDCVVYVEPKQMRSSTDEALAAPSREQLDRYRSFLSCAKHASFTIPPEMSDVIQHDFVERRQASQGGEGMTQEDLLFRMTASRLLALSRGKTALDRDSWIETAELDERRKDRVPDVVRKAAKAAKQGAVAA